MFGYVRMDPVFPKAVWVCVFKASEICFFFFWLFRPHLWHTEAPRLEVGGGIGVAAAGLSHSHSNIGSEPCL